MNARFTLLDEYPYILADFEHNFAAFVPEQEHLQMLCKNFSLLKHIPPARLDTAIAVAFSDMGMRGRRRLWDTCQILVNGRPKAAGFEVRGGDVITVVPLFLLKVLKQGKTDGTEDGPACSNNLKQPGNCSEKPALQALPFTPYVLHKSNDFCAVYKPACLHSVRIAGKSNANLEDMLPDILETGEICPPVTDMHMLTRLDFYTSGVVLLGTVQAEAQFRVLEAEGLVHKRYFALVCGVLQQPLTISNDLNTHKRIVTKVENWDSVDATRHTIAIPLKSWSESWGDFSLVEVQIKRGARHQIRAHLAHVGYPLVGDIQYKTSLELGPVLETLQIPACPVEKPGFLLHHAAVSFPGFAAACVPRWGMLTEYTAGLLPEAH